MAKLIALMSILSVCWVLPASAVYVIVDGLSDDTQVTDLGENVRLSGGWGGFELSKKDFLTRYGTPNVRGNRSSFRVSGELTREGNLIYTDDSEAKCVSLLGGGGGGGGVFW